LRANANLALGRLEDAAQALARQHVLLGQQLASSNRDEDVRALTLVETRLAENASARRDYEAAATWLGKALEHADALAARLHSSLDGDQLRVLLVGAELHALGRVPVHFDLPRRLSDAYQKLSEQRTPAHRVYQNWFEVYLALNPPEAAARCGPPGNAQNETRKESSVCLPSDMKP
jgi:hypothetical protein